MNAPKQVLITGASGLVGRELTTLLLQKEYGVVHLGRTGKQTSVPAFVWDVDRRTIDKNALQNADVIVHLAGAGVADKRWTRQRKQELYDSRIKSTQLLFNELKKTNHRVRAFISASAIGYYGFENQEWLEEESAPGTDFLAQLTYDWEKEADAIESLGIRVVKLRTGIVLSSDGGTLPVMAKPIRFFAGAALGPGSQYVSWIHIGDLVRMYAKAIEDEQMRGAYNAVAPLPVTNLALTRAIAWRLGKPLILPAVPKMVLRVLLGEMADLVVTGSRVSPRKIEKAGFKFQYTSVEQALTDLMK